MKVKTSELIGVALDWAVIKAVYPNANNSPFWLEFSRANSHSKDWGLGGSIIDGGVIGIRPTNQGWVGLHINPHIPRMKGKTPLIAAMRCYVASKLGEEVEIPDELI